MTNGFGKAVAAIIACTMINTGVSTGAQAACWTPDEVRAANVRDLDTMLMVSALRCRGGDSNFLAAYNDFVVNGRPALTDANNRLRHHFTQVSARATEDALDRYVTRVANRYGAGVDGLNCRDFASLVRAAAASGNSIDELAALAERADIHPELGDGMCGVDIALAH